MFTKFLYLLLLLNFKWTFWNFNEKEWWNSNKHLISNELLNVYQTGPYFGNSKRKIYNDETIFLYTNLRPSLPSAYRSDILMIYFQICTKTLLLFQTFPWSLVNYIDFPSNKEHEGKVTYVHPSWSCHLNNLALSFYLCSNHRMVHHSKDVISRFTRKMKIIRECQSRLWISVCGATFVGFSMTWHKCCLHGWMDGWLAGWMTDWVADWPRLIANVYFTNTKGFWHEKCE